MAKWGEGDPRWIVEERPDATNVNNWHWTEKNADCWSKRKLEELLLNLEIRDPKSGSTVLITEMEKCEGEARANNRKAKLIFFYEWIIILKWKGRIKNDGEEVTGKVEIPNLSEEHTDMKDVDVEISLTSSSKGGKDHEILKEMMRKGEGATTIRKKLSEYVEALKTEFSQGLILPNNSSTAVKSSGGGNTKNMKNSNSFNSSLTASAAAAKQMTKLDLGSKITLDTLKMEETFKCTGQEIYNALTQKQMIQIFTSSPATMSDEAANGEKFEMLNGNIQGEFLQIVPFSKIVQRWRLKSWPPGHYSKVEINIVQTKEDTKLSLIAHDVPVKEMENTKQGWKRYYWESIRRCFGYGSILF